MFWQQDFASSATGTKSAVRSRSRLQCDKSQQTTELICRLAYFKLRDINLRRIGL